MGLNKFEKCHPEHQENLEYCCFKSNKVFCQTCWFRDSHPFKCFSSRCGHFEKLAHLVIDKNLEMKVMHHTAEMASSYEVYEKFYRRIYQFKQIIALTVRQDLESKLPLFLWSAAIEMLGKKNTKSGDILFEEGTCSEMLKLIRRKDTKKYENLEEAVNEFEKINSIFAGLKAKNEKRVFDGTLDDEIEQCIKFYNNEAGTMIGNLKSSVKKHIEGEVKRMLANFDPPIEYNGVKFSSKFNFGNSEGYKTNSLVSDLFPEMDSPSGKNYHGIDLRLETLEHNPQSLLESAKCILKEKIFKIFHNIKEMKSSYPYKYGYVMSTTLTPDRDYEMAVLNLEKLNIKSMERKIENPFLNSVNIVVMGPELITVQFRNFPKNSATINIYNATEQRDKFYAEFIDKMLFEKVANISKIELKKTINKIPFEDQLTPVGLVYAYFQIAYEHLFTPKEQRAEFDDEKYAQARGSKLFSDAISKWDDLSEVDLELKVSIPSIIPLFI